MHSTPGVEVFMEKLDLTWANPIASNRNEIVKRFKSFQPRQDFLMMLDDDVMPIEGNPFEYAHADKDIIGFPAKVRQLGRELNWVAYIKSPTEDAYCSVDFGKIDDTVRLLHVDVVGTGAILIHRRVLEAIKAPFMYEFDEDGVSIVGQDFGFCRKAKAAGFEIYVAPQVWCEHFKEFGLLDFSGYVDSDYRDLTPGLFGMTWGDWSITEQDWRFIRDIINREEVKTVLEFGAGLSSLLMAAVEGLNVLSYETDTTHAEDIKQKFGKFGSRAGGSLNIRLWDGKEIKEILNRFDLAFVDGPKGKANGGPGREASIRIASGVSDRIIVHDAGRGDEAEWQRRYLQGEDKFRLVSRSATHRTRCHFWKRR
jgi:hypothetical protein